MSVDPVEVINLDLDLGTVQKFASANVSDVTVEVPVGSATVYTQEPSVLVGVPGQAGIPGPIGPNGPPGPQGIQGIQGVAGVTGPQGPIGPTGLAGATGPQGNLTLAGIGAPSTGTGNPGDFYIDTVSTTEYGPKASGIPAAEHIYTVVTPPGAGSGAYSFGTQCQFNVIGTVTAIRFYRADTSVTSRAVRLYTSTGTLITSATSSEAGHPVGWEEVPITPHTVTVGENVVIAYDCNGVGFGYNSSTVAGTTDITPVQNWYNSTGIGVYPPTGGATGPNYGLDLSFTPGSGVLWPVMISSLKGANGPAGPTTYLWGVSGGLTVTTGTARMYNDTGASRTISAVRASVGAAPAGSAVIVDVLKNGTTIFTGGTGRPSIAAGSNTATGTPAVTSWASGEYLTVTVAQIGSSTAGSDLTVQVVAT